MCVCVTFNRTSNAQQYLRRHWTWKLNKTINISNKNNRREKKEDKSTFVFGGSPPAYTYAKQFEWLACIHPKYITAREGESETRRERERMKKKLDLSNLFASIIWVRTAWMTIRKFRNHDINQQTTYEYLNQSWQCVIQSTWMVTRSKYCCLFNKSLYGWNDQLTARSSGMSWLFSIYFVDISNNWFIVVCPSSGAF